MALYEKFPPRLNDFDIGRLPRLDPPLIERNFKPNIENFIPMNPNRIGLSIPQLPPLPKPRVAKPQHSRESRLQFEKLIVSTDMSHFSLYRQGNNASFEGWQKSTFIDMNFYLKLEIPPHYPDQRPNLYVVLPHTLPTRNSGTINEMGSSHNFHTLDNGPGGCVQICHFSDNSWDASRTCIAVLIKGILWIEAYIASYANKMTIAEVLDQWDWRQEW